MAGLKDEIETLCITTQNEVEPLRKELAKCEEQEKVWKEIVDRGEQTIRKTFERLLKLIS
jgi:hypothetical protein